MSYKEGDEKGIQIGDAETPEEVLQNHLSKDETIWMNAEEAFRYGALMGYVLRVLQVYSFDSPDGLWWRMDGEYAPITFFVNCNDFFWWGTADSEQITLDNLQILEQSREDAKSFADNGQLWGDLLFCARVRGQRPQGAYYASIPVELWPLFDACGPERPTNMMNPKLHP